MGLILTSALKKKPTSGNGFDLVFLDSGTYDLDAIFESRNRQSSTYELLVEVKSDEEIRKKVSENFIVEIQSQLSSTFSQEVIQNYLSKTIEEIVHEYKMPLDDLPEVALEKISSKFTAFLRDLINDNNGITFTISVDNNEIRITTSFENNEYLDELFEKLLEKYQNNYDHMLHVVVGGLAISNVSSQKTRMKQSDFRKYLLGNSYGDKCNGHKPTSDCYSETWFPLRKIKW